MSPSGQNHWILGDASCNRVRDYCAAARRFGLPIPKCIDWMDVIRDGIHSLDDIPRQARLRIDSFGQRREVIAALVRHGGGNHIPAIGEILSLDHQYAGLCNVLRELGSWSQGRSDVKLDQDPSEIAMMFDKWATHHHMLPHRPETILLSTDPDQARRALIPFIHKCGGRVFVKPRYASSASGACCYRVCKNRHQLIAPIELVRESGNIRLFNSLHVRSFTDLRDIQEIFKVLIPQGMIAEAAINKARVEGERFDLRVVVINGCAEHLVIRQSASPFTNLHLGNRRGTVQSVVDAVGEEQLAASKRLALHAASRFPGTLYCGVDILLPRSAPPLVCEVNAFGDYLPGLCAAGQTVYEAIINAGNQSQEAFA